MLFESGKREPDPRHASFRAACRYEWILSSDSRVFFQKNPYNELLFIVWAISGKRESDPRHRPWQGRALPLSYSRNKGFVPLFYYMNKGVACQVAFTLFIKSYKLMNGITNTDEHGKGYYCNYWKQP